jgi:Tat protein translocase TatB subunit
MFGIGTPELLVILVLALVVVGPQRLPELARTIGRALREFRKVQDEVRGMVQTGIGGDLDEIRTEIRGTTDELRRTSKEITGGVKEAADLRPLLPKKRPGAHRTRRLGSVLSGTAGGATTAPGATPDRATAPAAEATTQEPEDGPGPDAGPETTHRPADESS